MNKRRKVYVLDTSVVMEDPDVFYKLGDVNIIIPTAVIKEIDGLKRNTDEMKAMAARKVSRTLDRIGSNGHIGTEAKTFTGSTVLITAEHTEIDDLASNADNRIVGTAIRLKEDPANNVVLVSTDGNMRNVTRAYGIRAENYPFYIGDAISRPPRRYLPVRNAVPYIRCVPAKPAFYNKGSGSKTIGAIVISVIAIFVFILLVSAR
ncbi:MAG TPA: PIN domain-containing protein [Thermodesulfovibrionales bacterium]|nr:PIN domain-containing protein [Thermodesulfovibrionales bacterium]